MSLIDWNHPVDEAGQWDGFNDPGIEHFMGLRLKNLAREIVQNSLDAHDPSISNPVKVVFNEIEIPTDQIPNLDTFRNNIDLCLQSAIHEGAKAQEFFNGASKILRAPRVKALVISDYNTTGIAGPCLNNNPYFAFMKAKGQSKKKNESASGSFGIGKFAPYAVSGLRTVFVSTVFRDSENKLQQYSQGKSILMSFDDSNNCRHQSCGFWGVAEKCMPIEGDIDAVPLWLSRIKSENSVVPGTRLVILGVSLQKQWRSALAASIAENFFGAIQSNRLEVSITGGATLNATSLANHFSDNSLRSYYENDDASEDCFNFDNCKAYHEVLTNGSVVVENHQNRLLGNCELRILVGEGLAKRVCFLRNGMFISDSLKLPGLRRLSEFKDFVAVFQCLDPNGVSLLRRMEPPKHDGFEIERLSENERKKADKALKDIAQWIREALTRNARDPVTDITLIDELKDFFPDEVSNESLDGNEEVNPFADITISLKPMKPRIASNSTLQNGSTGIEDIDNSGGGGSDGAGGGDAEGGVGNMTSSAGGGQMGQRRIELENPRMVQLGDNTIRLSITPLETGTAFLQILESGADSDFPCGIVAVSQGQIQNGRIKIDVVMRNRLTIDVTLNEISYGAVKVVALEV